jgi:hypothetical protein
LYKKGENMTREQFDNLKHGDIVYYSRYLDDSYNVIKLMFRMRVPRQIIMKACRNVLSKELLYDDWCFQEDQEDRVWFTPLEALANYAKLLRL